MPRRVASGSWGRVFVVAARKATSRIRPRCERSGTCARADWIGKSEPMSRWQKVRDELHAEVLQRGWSDHHHLGAFRPRYEGDNLDAATLLIPIVGFLPPDHPRVKSTVEKVMELLSIDGFVYRFDPLRTPGVLKEQIPLGQFEGAFLPCTFWLATVLAKMGRHKEAESILERAEKLAGPVGLFAEGVDARSNDFLGNHPLLFSQIEYVRAVRTLNEDSGSSRCEARF
jgi:GH15 family glucan-1,4-alpha-glucosidase